MRRGFGPDVNRIVIIKPAGSGAHGQAREIYNDSADDDDDDGEIRVRILKRTGSGRLKATDWVADDNRKRKKSSRALRPMEKLLRRAARRRARLANIYLGLHDKSNRRKKNGWAKDFGRNVVKTYRRASKSR